MMGLEGCEGGGRGWVGVGGLRGVEDMCVVSGGSFGKEKWWCGMKER